jgi:hypothetical protein
MGMLTVGSVPIKAPKDFDITIEDVYKQNKKNAKGKILRDRVGTKRTLTIKWGVLSQTEMEEILLALSDVFVSITYPDTEEGDDTTKTFAVGSKTATKLLVAKGETYWESLEITFEEQ